jgi:peptidoglycan lytic transglycosylase
VKLKNIASLALVIMLVGCSTPSRYSIEQDIAPDVELDVSKLPDPVPVYEPRSRGGNKSPYEVWGKTYHVLPTAEGYQEQGRASWYGAKFHGHRTSNGETYNMYEMSAAHKSLPLPSYAKVTNLDNGRSVIVRVNDRGPFHDGRIIDLSYAAAKKLGYYSKGTANVEVEAIVVAQSLVAQNSKPENNITPVAKSKQEALAAGYAYFIQIGAFSTEPAAEQLKSRVDAVFVTNLQNTAFVTRSKGATKVFHRVRMGPYYDLQQAEELLKQLNASKLGSPMIITRSVSS